MGPLLVVEDSADTREMLAEVLELEDHRVELAADGCEALAWLARGERPRLVLLDFHLPDAEGGELLDRLRALPAMQGVPVLAISGAEVRHPDLAGVLRKPFGVDELLRAVSRLLR